jgi:hypothetical protein
VSRAAARRSLVSLEKLGGMHQRGYRSDPCFKKKMFAGG